MSLIRTILPYYRLDLRAVSLMRILIAVVIITDLLIRFGDTEAFYSNTGMWRAEVMYNLGWQPGFWTLHCLFDSKFWVNLLFCIHLLFAVFLLLGYKTRFSTFSVWVLYISLHNRNLFVLQSGDDLLRLILLWGLFLSWGSHYSLDAKKGKKVSVYPAAQLGYLFLIVSVYAFTALLKTDKEWHSEASALYYALSLEQLRLPLIGDWLYHSPQLMATLTHVVYGLEVLLPFLLVWPGKKGRSRGIAFVLILLLHLGIGVTLFVGLFFWISITAAVGLLPSAAMDAFEILLWKKNSKAPEAKNTEPFVKTLILTCCALIFALSLMVNLSCLDAFPYRLTKELMLPVNALRLNQYWGMFSPGILKKDGWLVYHGIDAEGRQWDLRTNSDYVDYSKPRHIVSRYQNDRWRKLAENMQNDQFTFLRHLYSNYYLKRWKQQHPEKNIVTLNLYFMEQTTLPNYKKTEAKKILYCVSTAP